ncbi:MAG: hypothetical protein DMF68_17160 [Acidobacteria bacterium]|nr:MAG: hypothetical protein DMF68_17160 [Acidobacteriota bacterium]
MTSSQIMGQAAGWTLLNFIWQGILIAMALSVALRFLRSHSSGARYLASCAALVLLFAAPILTFSYLVSDADSFNAKERLQTAAAATNERAGAGAALNDPRQSQLLFQSDSLLNQENASTLRRIESQLDRVAPYLMLAWLAGVAFLFIRFISGWRETRTLKREVGPPLAGWQMILDSLARQVRVSRPVRLCESALVEVPTVIGWLRPLILFPAKALVGLEPQAVRALLAHELAHILRYDYLVNMLQALVEILLFYHPAVWWVSRQVRVEREHACDDMALSLCNEDAVVYARALLSVEEMRAGASSGALALGADGGSLVARVRRIVSPKPSRTSPLAATVSIVLFIAVGAVNLLLLKGTQAKTVSDSSTTNLVKAQTGKSYQAMSKDEQSAFIAEKARDIARRMSQTEYQFTPAFESEIQKSVDYYVGRIGNNLGDQPGKGDARFIFERGQVHAPTLIRIFKARNISPLIGLYIPLIESEYLNLEKPNSMGALGMFQFLPQTGERYGLTKQDLTDVEKSADAAARYIADSLGLFHSDHMKEALALLSYNRGRGKVTDDLRLVTDDENKRCSICALTAARDRLDKDFQSENVHYVPLFFAAAIIGENPQAFGLNLQPLSSYER